MKIFTYIIIIIASIGAGIFTYYHITPPAPCSEPIYYTIGNVDQRFDMSKDKFATDIAQAVSVWNSALNKPILTSDTDSSHLSSDLRINLIYDTRQQVTGQLKNISSTVDDQKTAYTALKAQYDTLSKQYTTNKSVLDAKINTYSQALAKYNAEVDMWNSKGGAPRDQYTTLQNEKQSLDSQLASLKSDQQTFTQLYENLKTMSDQLNSSVYSINHTIMTYNTIGTGIGEQFNEGEYIEDSTGHYINIYQYNNEDQLIRVLEHEFGHAIGLDHVNDPKAVMYYLNKGTNEKLTASDIAELNTVCSKK